MEMIDRIGYEEKDKKDEIRKEKKRKVKKRQETIGIKNENQDKIGKLG